MALVVGTNSWCTISEADTHLTDRLGAANWFLLSDSGDPGTESKTSLLITSFYLLFNNVLFDIAISSSDENVKHAQIEFALFLLENRIDYFKRMQMQASGIEQFTRSEWSEKLKEIGIPVNILGMLTEYGVGNTVVTLLSPYDTD